MARDPDDEALSWGDENDPTYAAGHPAALDEDDLEEDIPVVDVFSSSAVAAPLPPQTPPVPGGQVADAEVVQSLDAEQPPGLGAEQPPSLDTEQAPSRDAQALSLDAQAATAPDARTAGRQPGATSAARTPSLTKPLRADYPPAVASFPSGTAAPSSPPAAGYPAATATATTAAAADATTGAGTTAAPTGGRAARIPTVDERADAAEDAAVDDDLASAEEETQQLSSVALITFGVFGGVFLLYTVGWLVTFIRNPVDPSGLAGIVQNAQGILAIAAPALWFVVTLIVAAKRKVPVRVIWLGIGVVVLLPWPFLTGY